MSNPIQTATIIAGDIDADGSPYWSWRAPCDVTIIGIYLIGGTAVERHATSYHRSTAANRGVDNLRNTNIATRDTLIAADPLPDDWDNIAIGIPWELTLEDAIYLEISEGEVIRITATENGAAYGDIADATYQINYINGNGVGHSCILND